jgi:enoyl-CoA hydratase/carnithine racemase
VVIVTGAGRAFCAGGDLSSGTKTFDAVAEGRASGSGDHVETGGPLAMSIFGSRKPFIAALNGAAVGIGLTMILPMDLRIAVPGAKLAMSFTRRGIVPDACATWFLPRLVGLSTALDWAATGRTFMSEDAHRAGLVDELAAPEQLMDRARQRAREYLAAAPIAVAMTRQMVLRMAAAEDPLDAYMVESPAIFELGRSTTRRRAWRRSWTSVLRTSPAGSAPICPRRTRGGHGRSSSPTLGRWSRSTDDHATFDEELTRCAHRTTALGPATTASRPRPGRSWSHWHPGCANRAPARG